MKGLVMRLVAVALGLAVAALGLEVVLRLGQRHAAGRAARDVGIHEPHDSEVDLPHRRSRPQPPPTSDHFEILVVGDSFTWGDGIYHADTYGVRLESLLERMDRGLDVRVSLESRPGWNTKQEYQAVRRKLRSYEPDLIVLGFCLNDAEPRRQQGNDDIKAPLRRRRPTAGLGGFLFAHSRLFRLAAGRLENSRQRRAFDRYYHELYRRPGWQDSLDALDGFRRLSWERRIPLAAVVFPIFDQQLDAGYAYRDLHQMAMGALRERDIPAADLLPAYRGVDAVRLAVAPFTDPHPNELAHRIASQVLADFLVRQKLVPITPAQRDRVELSLPARRREKR